VQTREQKQGKRLWVAGAHGFLAYSDNDGQCWTRYDYASDLGEFHEPKTNPCAPPRQTAQLHWPKLVPVVLAAPAEELKASPQQGPSTGQKPRVISPNQSPAQVSQVRPAVTVFPTTLDFGEVNLPNPTSQAAAGSKKSFTVTNNTDNATQVAIGGFRGDGASEFQVEAAGCGGELKPRTGCSAEVIFYPSTVGKKQVVLTIQSSGSSSQSLSVTAIVHPAPSSPDTAKQNETPSRAANVVTTAVPKPSAAPPPPQPPSPEPDLLAIEFAPGGRMVSTGGFLWELTAENVWRFKPVISGTPENIGNREWILVSKPGPWATETWVKSAAALTFPKDRLPCTDCTIWSQVSEPGTHSLWAAGWTSDNGSDEGVLLRSEDDGAKWEAMTRGALSAERRSAAATGRPWVWPPLWYLALLVIGLGLALPALLPPPGVPPPSTEAQAGSVEGRLSSDKPLDPGDPDVLGLTAIALGLSRFLRNEKTLPPLTVAVNGEWGTGKSSLMNLLRCDLQSYGMCPVWFNAWHHQKEEHLLAALLQTVRLEAVPSLWNLLGVPFRVRLLCYRFRRRWPVLVLLAAASIFLVFLDFHLRMHHQSDLFIWITSQFFPSTGDKSAQPLSTVPVQGGLVALFATVAALWKGLTAFGANPASLLASVAQGNKMKDLDAQTSFRQRFAVEFRDFTRALGPRRPLVVFIDDLDRCLPENVRDVLEAVNFLVSSGDCFVVLGMDRVQVQRAVGLSFQKVAEEASGRRSEVPANGSQPAPADASSELARAKRAEFAQKYLEKLINLEVRVPLAIDDATKQRLFKPVSDQQPESPLESGLQWGLRTSQWAVPTALTLLLLVGAYKLSTVSVPAVERWMTESRVQSTANAKTAPITPPGSTNSDVNASSGNNGAESKANLPAKGTPSSTEKKSFGELLSPIPGADRPAVSNGKEVWPPSWALSVPFYLLAVFILLVTNVVLTTRPGVVTHDSRQFADAMEQVWYPLVLAKQNTPRAAKRFVNRVRYLAMRQRGFEEAASWWERVLFPQRLREPARAKGWEPIPEPLLVAMAAMEQMEPLWVYDDTVFSYVTGNNSDLTALKPPANDPVEAALLDAARTRHRKLFPAQISQKMPTDWQSLPAYRSAFLVIWPRIDIAS
jgi:hypothetical protein